MAGLEAQKRPLMLAALNGLSVARVTGREDCRHDATRIPVDERVSAGLGRRVVPSRWSQDLTSPSWPRPFQPRVCEGGILQFETRKTWSNCIVLNQFSPTSDVSSCFVKLEYQCLATETSH